MYYIERLKLWLSLDKVVYVMQCKGTVDSPMYTIDGTKDYFKVKTVNDAVFNLTLQEGEVLILEMNYERD